MSIRSSLRSVKNCVAEAGPSTVASRNLTTSSKVYASTQGSGRIPQARRENGENMSPKEWADQLRNVREWKTRQETMREQTASVRPPSYSSLAESAASSTPSDPHSHLLSQLTAATAHLGHIPSALSPPFIPYIHSKRSNIHLIDLEQTVPLLQRASEFIKRTVEKDGAILFVGTRKPHRQMVRKAVERLESNGFGVAGERWMPGTLTNSLSYFGPKPIRASSHLPDIVVILNPSENLALIKECNISNIPTVGIVDTDTDPRIVTYAIPANMESMRTAELIVSTLSLAGKAGRDKRLAESVQGQRPRR